MVLLIKPFKIPPTASVLWRLYPFKNNKVLHVILIVVIFSALSNIQAIDDVSYADPIAAKADQKVDLDWFYSIKKWYVPLWSALSMVRTASIMFDKATSEITEDEISKDSCFVARNSDYHVWCWGQDKRYNLTAIMQGKDLVGFSTESKRVGPFKYLFKLTDNKYYILTVISWKDHQASFSVWSAQRSLREKDYRQLVHMLKALGFKKELFRNNTYDSCVDPVELKS